MFESLTSDKALATLDFVGVNNSPVVVDIIFLINERQVK